MLPKKKEIKKSWDRIKGLVKNTPLLSCVSIDEITGAKLLFKCENFQKTGSFKYRGATNAVLKLPPKSLELGVCTHSSGNHAQALALAAHMQGVKAHIVMPSNAPEVKVAGVMAYHGIITFCEPTLDARESTLAKVMEETGATFVPPYNYHDVIEGQATCLYEALLELNEKPDIVMCPVGGGGLLSGTLLTAKYFAKGTDVIAAEPLAANDAFQSLRAGKLIPSINPVTIADGLKTSLGDITWPVIRDNVSDIVTASEEGIKKAMLLIWERMKIVAEPSAAVPLAGILENPELFQNKTVLIIISGGNLDLKKLPW